LLTLLKNPALPEIEYGATKQLLEEMVIVIF